MGLVKDATNNDLTYKIIGAAMAVHSAIGFGYKEEVYEKALLVELQKRDIAADSQVPVHVYHAEEVVATFFLDIFVQNLVVVEIKAFPHLLTNDELAQVINYLKATQAPVGLLLNFGRRALEYRRVFPGKAGSSGIQRLGRDDAFRSRREKPGHE